MAQSMEHKVGQAADQAKDTAHGLLDKAKDAAGQVADKARDLASNVSDQARSAASHLGAQVRDLSGNVRDQVGSAGEAVSDGVQRGTQYFQQQGFDGVLDDVGSAIRRNPVPAVLIGVGIGFVLGRMMRS